MTAYQPMSIKEAKRARAEANTVMKYARNDCEKAMKVFMEDPRGYTSFGYLIEEVARYRFACFAYYSAKFMVNDACSAAVKKLKATK